MKNDNEQAILDKQVELWKKEIDRLQDLVEAVTEAQTPPAENNEAAKLASLVKEILEALAVFAEANGEYAKAKEMRDSTLSQQIAALQIPPASAVMGEVVQHPDDGSRDYDHYDYDEYTTGRKQDYGHSELNIENGWHCFDWDRDDYTETMEMKKPKPGNGWKPFRVYWHAGCFKDFMYKDNAEKYIQQEAKKYPNMQELKILEIDLNTGEEVFTKATAKPEVV